MDKVSVRIDGVDHLLDVRPADHMRYSDTARRHKWPTNPQEDPIRAMYFIAFAAAQRTGLVPKEQGWQTFLETVESIDVEDDEADPMTAES